MRAWLQEVERDGLSREKSLKGVLLPSIHKPHCATDGKLVNATVVRKIRHYELMWQEAFAKGEDPGLVCTHYSRHKNRSHFVWVWLQCIVHGLKSICVYRYEAVFLTYATILKKKTSTMSLLIALPSEILLKILDNLPLKDLARAECVRKHLKTVGKLATNLNIRFYVDSPSQTAWKPIRSILADNALGEIISKISVHWHRRDVDRWKTLAKY